MASNMRRRRFSGDGALHVHQPPSREAEQIVQIADSTFYATYSNISLTSQMAGLVIILAVVLWAQVFCNNTNSAPALVFGAGVLALARWRGSWSLRAGARTFNAMQAMQLVGGVVMGAVHGSEEYMAQQQVLYESTTLLRVTDLVFLVAGALCALATDGTLPTKARGGQLAIAPGLMLLNAVHMRLHTSDLRMCYCLLTYGGSSYVVGASVALGVEVLVRKLRRVHEEATAALRAAEQAAETLRAQNEEATGALRAQHEEVTAALRAQHEEVTAALRAQNDEATAALRAQNDEATAALRAQNELSSAHEQAVAVGMSLSAAAIDVNIMLMARGGESAPGDGSDSESGATFFPTEDNGGGESSQRENNDGGGSESTEETSAPRTSATADDAAVFVDSKEHNFIR